MKRKVLSLIAAVAFTATALGSVSQAKTWDDNPEAKFRLGVDIPFVIPVGDWSDFSGVGLGILLARAEWRALEDLAVTARLGYIFHLSASHGGADVSTSEVPLIFPGAKYFFGDFYLAAEMGLVLVRSEATVNLGPFGTGSGSSTDARFGITVGPGYEIGPVDIRAQLFIPSLADADKFLGIMLTVGYSFLHF